MTERQFVREVTRRIGELTDTLSKEVYAAYLERLVFEIEDELERLLTDPEPETQEYEED